MGKKIYKTCGGGMAIVAVILCCFSAKAEKVKIGDLWYALNPSTLTAEVVMETEGGVPMIDPLNEYLNLEGDLEIPKRVSYKGDKYTVTSIGYCAFYGARNLTSVTIANTVTSIGEGAFSECTGLKKVKIRDAVDVVIGVAAFAGCSNLVSIILPSRLTRMYHGAFAYCSALESVTWNAKSCEYLTGDDYYSVNVFGHPGTLSAFYKCENISSFVFGEGVESIPDYLLIGGWESKFPKIKEIVIPNSVDSIGFSVFSGCEALESVKWNAKSCKTRNYGELVFDYANKCPFYGCKNISSFVFGEGVESIPGYLLNGTRTSEFSISSFPKIKEIVIPNSVVSIGAGAFFGCDSLCNLVIGESLRKLDDNPFIFANLQSVTISEFNKNLDCRNNCNAIIETKTNRLIAGRQNTIIPTSVTSIGDYAFYSLRELQSIKIPNSVTSIGDFAFYDCSGLKSIKIPNSVTAIGDFAFNGCSRWEPIKIPNSVRKIGVRAFPTDCGELYSEILWPEKVTLGHIVRSYSYVVEWWAFDNLRYKCTLHVPMGTTERYQAAEGWRDFNIVEDMINGDINGDEITDVSDVVAISNHVLGDVGTTIDSVIGDVNGSGAIDVADVVTLANYVLGE